MKEVTYTANDKVNINTGHKTFDRQCECLMTGNVWGNAQFSSYIRSYDECECNGRVNPCGHLQEFDLGHFKNVPQHILKSVHAFTHSVPAIFYEFRHWKKVYGSKEKVIHGYILTFTDQNNYRLAKKWYCGNGNKSKQIIDTVAEYISNE